MDALTNIFQTVKQLHKQKQLDNDPTSKQDLLATLENRNSQSHHTKDCKVADTYLVCWLTVCLAQNQHSKALFIIAGRGGRGLVWGDE